MENSSPRRGRPAGSGAQLPAAERSRQSRQRRKQSDSIRLDMTLDTDAVAALNLLMRHWGCRKRKDAVTRALKAAAATIGTAEQQEGGELKLGS